MDSATALTAGQKEMSAQIIKAGWYLLDLINSLLDMGAIDRKKLEMNIGSVILAECVQCCVAIIQPPANQCSRYRDWY